ncbi:MAG: hypothetical protein U0694_05995 [Anaerolineae bacterium]
MSDLNSPEKTPSGAMRAVRLEDSQSPEKTPSGTMRPVVAPPPTTGSTPAVPSTGQYPPVTGQMPPVREPQGSGCGCWLPAMITGFLVTILVVVGLFLPPISLLDRLLGTQYTMLDATGNGVQVDGMSFVVDPAALQGEFGVQLNSVPLNSFTTGTGADWVPAAQAAVPFYLALQSAVYSVESTGQTPDTITVSVDIPATVGDHDLLDLYTWDTATNRWTFTPSEDVGTALTATLTSVPDAVALFQSSPPDQPVVLVAIDNEPLTNDVAQLATIITPAGMQPTTQGTLVGSLAGGYDLNAPYRVLPVVRNFADPRAVDPQTVTAILANTELRMEHVRQITALAINGGFDGIFIDYRDLPADARDNFTAFMQELGDNLNRAGLLLGVVVPQAQNTAGTWDTGAYDWRALGASVDYLQINLGIDPNTYSPGENQYVEALLRWVVGEVDRHKILIGLSARSIREVSGVFTTIGYDEALSGLGNVSVEAAATTDTGIVQPGTEITASLDGFAAASGMDMNVQSPFIDYLDDSGNRVSRMWLTTGEALRFRMDRTLPFALAGVGLGDLLYDGVANDVLETVLNYKLGLPAVPTETELALRWTIEGSNGVIGQVTTDLNEPLVATVNAPDGNYAVNVDVVASDIESARSGAAVAVFAPTPTPTPLPTSTPTPTPTPTYTPVPIVATSAAPSGGNGSVVAPVAGSIAVGNFEYGGHVTGTSTGASDAMRRAGMSWMKVQLRYTPGMDPSAAAGPIGEAHARGFKILLGIVGNPGDLAAGGGGYVSGFASFLGGVASQGPDAIEVWNEANIDREWPNGQISGATYADMLRQAYQAIKGANGSVMVISAAPAPTGAEAAYPGAVVNDNNWVSQMVQAGGLNYMDCLGAHYNEGIVGPDQRSGDPRDDYYTRYFGGMLDTYWSISGGARPICFTELGYLTPEGYPPLDPYFGWAANTTVAQQASWLARTAALASQSGRVRLMIIWNIDFTSYGADPMAGYAIIRPNGSCPACDALAASR